MQYRTLVIRRDAGERASLRKVGLQRPLWHRDHEWALEADQRVTFARVRAGWLVCVAGGPPPGRHRTLSAAVLAGARWWVDNQPEEMAVLVGHDPLVRGLLLALLEDDEAAAGALRDRLLDLGVEAPLVELVEWELPRLGILPRFMRTSGAAAGPPSAGQDGHLPSGADAGG